MSAASVRKGVIPKEVRKAILHQSKRANVGHIGSCLCIVDILCVLYDRVLRISSPSDPDRDRFILSKGHAGLALYAVLLQKGWIEAQDLDTFCGDNSLLGVHPESALTGVDFSTGSLGHGISFATGAALAARLQGSARRVFCLVSDAECNEGSVWEAAMFAAHHGLSNLTVIVDLNGQQALGTTHEVQDSSNMNSRWQAFGWEVSECDGHSLDGLAHLLSNDGPTSGKPRVILAKTIFGKGVGYMEQGVPVTQSNLPVHTINWHYLPMSDAEYALALADVEAGI